MTLPTGADLVHALLTHTNVLLYGPPGTGKTYLMQEVARSFPAAIGTAGGSIAVDTAEEREPFVASANTMVRWVTFHQSYSYEDFVIGLRPDPASKTPYGLKAVPGVLLELAAFAATPGNSALLLVDELNRGNVSRIFGEFITLLEPDKRLAQDGAATDHTVYVRLPYLEPGATVSVASASGPVPLPISELGFALPRRVYLLASMNSVDKAVAPLDTALRRRFHVVPLAPSRADVTAALGIAPAAGTAPAGTEAAAVGLDVAQLAAEILLTVNAAISTYLGPDFTLGPWYLRSVVDPDLTEDEREAELASVWNHSIQPQLIELFQGQSEQLADVLGLSDVAAEPAPITLVKPPVSRLDLGASSYLETRVVDTQSTLAFLKRLISPTTPAA